MDEPLFGIPPDLIVGPSADIVPLADEANWGVNTFHVDRLRALTQGKGVIVGIVDTGVDRTHPLLQNCIAARDFTGSPNGARDVHGHGTHCTGTVGAIDGRIGMAPGCRTVHGKALSDSGSGAGTWIRDAIQWCVDQGATVISMSLGSPSEDSTITNKMEQLAAQGIWFAVAAGNSGGGTSDIDWPGRSRVSVATAALQEDLNPASFSSAGASIITSFAGTRIWSCKPGGGFQQMSGTSMATPGVAGILALYRSGLQKTNKSIPSTVELRILLQTRSTDTYTPGVDRRTGPGWISPGLLASNLTADPIIEGG